MLARQTILNLILAPLFLLAAILLVKSWIANKPEPRSSPPPPVIPRVAFLESSASEHAPNIETFGNVRAFQRSQVASQVAGKVISVSENFQAGRSVASGETLLTVEQSDYLAAIETQKSALATAKKTLAEEKSRSRIALQDWIDSGRNPADAPPFTLRKPQLAAAEADVASATATLGKANQDLERTTVSAPFAAIVQERTASPGNVITSGTVLGTLIDRERTEVRLPLTPEQAAQLTLPLSFALDSSKLPALSTTLTSLNQPGASWTAAITRTEPSLDSVNQVLFVVAEIKNPFDDPEAFLPIGAYVNATIAGKPIPNVHRLPESALLEDRYVWILDAEDTLRQQPVERIFSSGGYFLARIADPLTPEPLRVASRPLVSFISGDAAVPLDPNAPPPAPKKGGGKSPPKAKPH